MKARVKATGDIIEVREVTKYDSNYNPFVYYKVENGLPYREEQLDFEDLTEGKVDVKEKSLPKDEPDYWEKLKHQYEGMFLAGMLANSEWEGTYERLSEIAIEIAEKHINRLKKDSQCEK